MRSMLTWQGIWSNQRISWWLSKIKKIKCNGSKASLQRTSKVQNIHKTWKVRNGTFVEVYGWSQLCYQVRIVDEPTIVQDIFLARLEFVNLLKTSHTVLFIDSLYKTD